jgi:ribonuclease HII
MKIYRTMKKYDLSYLNSDIKILAGTDEAGRGPLAGPVVAAAVIFDNYTYNKRINDSKQLCREEREEMYLWIMKHALSYAVCAVSPGEIDRINILQASLKAMHISVKRLKINPDIILVDGNKSFIHSVPCIPVIQGDCKSFSIAAASIIAKVTRDDIMRRLCSRFPSYLWSKNKGYPTPEHICVIKQIGPCSLHRQTFLKKIFRSDTVHELEFETEEPVE